MTLISEKKDTKFRLWS